MDQQDAIEQFQFLGEALDGAGGFRPRVRWVDESVAIKDQSGTVSYATRRVPKTAGPCHLVPHMRESPEKFAGRAARAVYENHLREACERFVSYLGRRQPVRDGLDAPLTRIFVDDCDMRGTPLSEFISAFSLQARARGSMLLLIDMPRADDDGPVSLLDQIERRRVPYLRAIKPEHLADYDVDDETGLFERVSVCVNDDEDECIQTWTADGWEIRRKDDDEVMDAGLHSFGRCPVIAFTESGELFPCLGKYAQIADMSLGVFNNNSLLDEILCSQTFSILTLQVPDNFSQYSAAEAVATIGTSSMLIHPGATPAFVSPDQGNAETYLKKITQLEAGIARVGMQDASNGSGAAESGTARKLRFERLNADLATFARRLQAIERQMWALFHRALNTQNRVTVSYPSDFNLVDSAAELAILGTMSAEGFPAEVLIEKRAAIVGAEFDSADQETIAALMAAVREQAQE
ncbi:MAG: hypothetical protein RJA63_88 [Pseudomonadota bacterium]|jgi:hypothetical protein